MLYVVHRSYKRSVKKCATGAGDSQVDCTAGAPIMPAVHCCSENNAADSNCSAQHCTIGAKKASVVHFWAAKFRLATIVLHSKMCNWGH